MELPPAIRQLQVPLLYLNNIIALGFKPGPIRILSTLPTALLLALQGLYQKEHIYYGDQYSMNCLTLSLVFVYLDWIVLASPDKERWHKIQYNKRVGTSQDKNDAVPLSFFSRVWFGLRLASTNRYTGWSQQVKNTPIEFPIGYPRWRFIVRKTLRAAFMYVLTDTLDSYTASTPHGAFRGFENGKKIIGFDGYPLRYQFAFTWLHIVITYASLELFNTLYGIVAVLLGFAIPRDCPSSFGDLKKLYSVRNAWSVVWHQNCRRICSAPGIFLARDVIGLRKGSFASKYLQLFIGFFISAVVHGSAAMISHASFDDDGAFAVFIAQAIAIMVEDHVIDFGRYIGLRDSGFWRLVGFSWTVLWLGLSCGTLTAAGVRNGMWIHKYLGNLLGIGPPI